GARTPAAAGACAPRSPAPATSTPPCSGLSSVWWTSAPRPTEWRPRHRGSGRLRHLVVVDRRSDRQTRVDDDAQQAQDGEPDRGPHRGGRPAGGERLAPPARAAAPGRAAEAP